MNYLTYGNHQNKKIMLIHGMATTAKLCYEPLLEYLKDYYVILVEVDGHIENDDSIFTSIKSTADSIEEYIKNELDGHLDLLSGFSMGGTISVELMSRKQISIDKVLLDASFNIDFGLSADFYEWVLCTFIMEYKKRKRLPKFLIEMAMGKGNEKMVDTFFPGIQRQTLANACHDIYRYTPKEEVRGFKGKVLFIYGENEPYPKKGAKFLKTFIPDMETMELKAMGHGQFLTSSPQRYSSILLSFMNSTQV